MPGVRKFYYVAVEYYDAYGERTQRRFVTGRFLAGVYSFGFDVNQAKQFATKKAAKDYMANFILPTRAKLFIEDGYDVC